MEGMIDRIFSNPLYIILATLITIMIFWAILNRLIKAAVIVFIGIILYTGYMTYQGKQIPQNGNEIFLQGKEEAQKIKNIGIGLLKEFIIESITDKQHNNSQHGIKK